MDYRKLKPLHDRVIVRQLEAPEVSDGGIFLPDGVKERPCHGEVLATGPGKRDPQGNIIPMTVKPGELVIFNKYAGTKWGPKGKEVLFMPEYEILAQDLNPAPQEAPKS